MCAIRLSTKKSKKSPPRAAAKTLEGLSHGSTLASLATTGFSLWHGDRLAIKLSIFGGELGDLDDLVGGNVPEHLRCATRRPVDFQEINLGRFAQPDGLLQRVGAKAGPRRNVAVGVARPGRAP